MRYLVYFEDNSSVAWCLFVLLGILLQYSGVEWGGVEWCSVFSVLRDGFKITGGKKWMIRCLLRELCSMRQITEQTQHPPCSYIIVRVPPPASPATMVQCEICNVAGDCWGLLLLFPSGRQMLILPGMLSPGQLSIYISTLQLISLPIKVMKQSAAAFISLAPTDISLVRWDEREREQLAFNTGAKGLITKLVGLSLAPMTGDNEREERGNCC